MAQNNTSPDNLSEEANQENVQTVNAEQNKEAIWQQVDAVYNAARKAYLAGSLFPDVIDSLVATLQEIKNTETQNLGGLGEGKTQININESPDEETPR